MRRYWHWERRHLSVTWDVRRLSFGASLAVNLEPAEFWDRERWWLCLRFGVVVVAVWGWAARGGSAWKASGAGL